MVLLSTPSTSLVFKVTKHEPELVTPAKPTPHELKYLSDIDDQECLRFQIPVIQFYRCDPFMRGRDPAKVIRHALSEALVYYYPFAGRLREGPNRKLIVDCTGEGVIFIEADANITLDQCGDALQPPFPCLEELLYDVRDSGGILDCPLMLIQVTRLQCGGFAFAISFNHVMSDAAGLILFMNAVAKIARGEVAPSIPPVWQRELLNAREPPRITFVHHEYDQAPDTKAIILPLNDMSHRSFIFGTAEVSALRDLVPPHLRSCSKFELLTAFLWRCRIIALQIDPTEEVRVLFPVNARAVFNPPLPKGFYGNALAFPAALTTAGKLCQNPLGYALELVMKAKREVNEEYMKSAADLLVTRNRLHVRADFILSDVTRAGFVEVDFGWGEAVYGGPAKGGVGVIPGVVSFCISFKKKKGETGILVPICLPPPAMEIFVQEVNSILYLDRDPIISTRKTLIQSAL